MFQALDANEWGSGGGLVAPAVFKTVCDLTLSGRVGSIPMHSRQRASSSNET